MAVGIAIAIGFAQERLAAPGPLQADKTLVIAQGTEVPDILAQLANEGVIDNPFLVNVALWVEGKRSSVKAGEYIFKQSASARDVMDTLVSGKQILHSITIPEGLTTDQVLARLRDSDVLTGDIHETPKEGSLLPETYKVTRGMPRDSLIRKMEKDEDDAVARIWGRRSPDNPLKSPYEMVTLASIVEKETGKADERPRVAEVFLNRLTKHIRLQSDPTIVYGLVGGKGTLGRGILRSEVDQPTPYNTYVIDGLPPGPIANPGVAALEAVANPSRTKELYFVADGTGGHVFAETLDQHNKNVARWRQIEKDAQDKPQGGDVDHVAPSSTAPNPPGTGLPSIAPVRGNQHGQKQTMAVPAFGPLPKVQGQPAAALQALSGAASFANVGLIGQDSQPPAGDRVAVKAAAAKLAAAAPNRGLPASASAFANFSMGPDLDQTGLAIQGDTKGPRGPSLLDGPIDSSAAADPVNPTTIALSPAALADERARAAKYGLLPSSGNLPAAVPVPAANHVNAPPAAAAANQTQTAGLAAGHVPIYDASEGTNLDPLLNKTWDLNSSKTVPAGP